MTALSMGIARGHVPGVFLERPPRGAVIALDAVICLPAVSDSMRCSPGASSNLCGAGVGSYIERPLRVTVASSAPPARSAAPACAAEHQYHETRGFFTPCASGGSHRRSDSLPQAWRSSRSTATPGSSVGCSRSHGCAESSWGSEGVLQSCV